MGDAGIMIMWCACGMRFGQLERHRGHGVIFPKYLLSPSFSCPLPLPHNAGVTTGFGVKGVE